MERVVLFAGKEYPDGRDFALAATNHNRTALITVSAMPGNLDKGRISEDLYPVLWNRSTSLSARALLLQAENICGKLQEAVVIFDTSWCSAAFPDMTPETCSKAVDALVASYAYLVTELLARFKKCGEGTLVFVIKKSQTGEPEGGFSKPVSVLAGMAEGAFKGLGESIVTTHGHDSSLRIALVTADYGTADSHFANWLFEVLDAPNSVVGKVDLKKGPQWFKMGAKTGKTGFFHKK